MHVIPMEKEAALSGEQQQHQPYFAPFAYISLSPSLTHMILNTSYTLTKTTGPASPPLL